jgi:hypothetical protein
MTSWSRQSRKLFWSSNPSSLEFNSASIIPLSLMLAVSDCHDRHDYLSARKGATYMQGEPKRWNMHSFIGCRKRVKMQLMAVRWICKHSDCCDTCYTIENRSKTIANIYRITFDYVTLATKSILPRLNILSSWISNKEILLAIKFFFF